MKEKNRFPTAARRDSLRSYIRTDLADECCPEKGGAVAAAEHPPRKKGDRGFDYTESDRFGCPVSSLTVRDERGEAIVGKPVGHYITVGVGRLWLETDERIEAAVHCVATELRELASSCITAETSDASCSDDACPLDYNGSALKDTGCVLVAGLGNRDITADSVGPQAVSLLTVTRHIKQQEPELYEKLGLGELAAIAPGVLGQTGIETAELLRRVTDCVHPSLVVAIDALAARSPERLATTVQLTDTGIAPGSGIGNRRAATDRNSLGVPVIAVGVPTIVESNTLVCDTLQKAGIDELPPAVRSTLDGQRGLFVSLKESDAAVSALAHLVASAIEEAFSRD